MHFCGFLNDAIAISDLNHNNNENLTINNNKSLMFEGEIDNARNSGYNFNEIEASDIGIYCRDCDSTTFNNEIYPPVSSFMSHGLWAEYSDMSEFSNHNY